MDTSSCYQKLHGNQRCENAVFLLDLLPKFILKAIESIFFESSSERPTWPQASVEVVQDEVFQPSFSGATGGLTGHRMGAVGKRSQHHQGSDRQPSLGHVPNSTSLRLWVRRWRSLTGRQRARRVAIADTSRPLFNGVKSGENHA